MSEKEDISNLEVVDEAEAKKLRERITAFLEKAEDQYIGRILVEDGFSFELKEKTLNLVEAQLALSVRKEGSDFGEYCSACDIEGEEGVWYEFFPKNIADKMGCSLKDAAETMREKLKTIRSVFYEPEEGEITEEITLAEESRAQRKEKREAAERTGKVNLTYLLETKEGEDFSIKDMADVFISEDGVLVANGVLNVETKEADLRKSTRQILKTVLKKTEELSAQNKRHEERIKRVEASLEKANEERVKDPMTGLYNRRFFDEVLGEEIKRAKRYEGFSVIMLDIDYFKSVNDLCGHSKGDTVLKKVAEVFKSVLRESDIAARWGGEEFVVILPKTDVGKAVITAEKIRKAIEEIDFKKELKERENTKGDVITVSLGVAEWEKGAGKDAGGGWGKEKGEKWEKGAGEELMNNADKALYLAKNMGRNNVQVFGVES